MSDADFTTVRFQDAGRAIVRKKCYQSLEKILTKISRPFSQPPNILLVENRLSTRGNRPHESAEVAHRQNCNSITHCNRGQRSILSLPEYLYVGTQYPYWLYSILSLLKNCHLSDTCLRKCQIPQSPEISSRPLSVVVDARVLYFTLTIYKENIEILKMNIYKATKPVISHYFQLSQNSLSHRSTLSIAGTLNFKVPCFSPRSNIIEVV